MTRIRTIFFTILFAAFVTVTFTQCKKQKKPKAEITVRNANGGTVSGAKVRVHSKDVPPPARPGVVEKEGTTNSSGVIEFEIENEAILTVEALQITGGDSLYGKGTVKFEKNETTRQSITIRKIQ